MKVAECNHGYFYQSLFVKFQRSHFRISTIKNKIYRLLQSFDYAITFSRFPSYWITLITNIFQHNFNLLTLTLTLTITFLNVIVVQIFQHMIISFKIFTILELIIKIWNRNTIRTASKTPFYKLLYWQSCVYVCISK